MNTKRIKYKLQLFKNINSQNYNINQRDLYKKISLTHEMLNSVGAAIYTGSYINASKYPFSKIPYDTILYPKNNAVDPYIYWNYLDHNFYKNNVTDSNYNDGMYLDTDIKRNFYENATVLNIPTEIYKSKIKPGSLVINDYSSKSNVRFIDDSNCNIILENTASFAPIENLILDYSFNEKYKERIAVSPSSILIKDLSIYKNNGIPTRALEYSHGFITTGSNSEFVGTQVVFDGSSSIFVNDIPQYKFKGNDYSIAFWIDTTTTSNDQEYQYILSKQQLTNLEVKEKKDGVITYKYKKLLTGNYPFSVRLITSGSQTGHLYFSRLGGDTEVFVTSSISVSDTQHHVVCQKSGSSLQIYIDGVLDSSFAGDVNGRTDNTSPIYFGSLNNETMFYTGKLDEIKIYNTVLTEAQIQTLADNDYDTCNALQTNQIGNIFYKHGDIVLSTINPKYKKVLLGHDGNGTYISGSQNTGFDINFRREHTLYEHEIVCKIPAAQFNFSTNPTLKINNESDTEKFKPFVTGSDFRLYFTTIGLYNDNYELLAIAKLANPLPKYEDKDINIIVKFDVD